MLRCFCALLLLLGLPVQALEMAGTAIPENINVDSAARRLTLAGDSMTHRQYMPFYGVALHLAQQRPQRAVLVQGLAACRITLVWFASNLSAEEVRAYFTERFDAPDADPEVLTRIQPRVEQLLALMPAVDRGTAMTFDYDPDRGMIFSVDGVPKGALAGVEFNRRLLGLWLGADADPESREALLAETR